MKYFKMIKDNEIIGAISSEDFICYVPGCGYMRTNESFGEYIEYNNQYYRSTWMKTPHTLYDYTEVSVLPITEDEYIAFRHAIETNDVIQEDTEDEEEIQPTIDPVEQESIEFIRSSKIAEMSHICRQTIESGFDLNDEHFSLDTQDQLNLITLSALADTQEYIPYHADGQLCRFYSAAEIKTVVAAATQFKMYHTTYYNALKAYINSLNTIEEITAIYYGIELPEEFQSDVLKAIM